MNINWLLLHIFQLKALNWKIKQLDSENSVLLIGKDLDYVDAWDNWDIPSRAIPAKFKKNRTSFSLRQKDVYTIGTQN